MDALENHSEGVRLRQYIAEEYEAAMFGLSGQAYSSTKHEFITRRIEQIGICHGSLRHLAASRKPCHRGREGEE